MYLVKTRIHDNIRDLQFDIDYEKGAVNRGATKLGAYSLLDKLKALKCTSKDGLIHELAVIPLEH